MLNRRTVLAGLAGGAMAARDAFAQTPMAFTMPANACDVHQHIIGDPARFPMVATRVYTPPQAPLAGLQALHAQFHITRAVLVQPSFYGVDNSCLLDALKQLGAAGRGIVVVSETTSLDDLRAMNALGIRGMRINQTGGAHDLDVLRKLIQETSRRVTPLGWHVQTFLPLKTVAALSDVFAGLPTPIVFDHFGGATAAGASQPGFAALCDLVKQGNCYVKLTAPYHESKRPTDYADMTPLAHALVAARADRLLWGTDWPHTDSDQKPGQKPTDIAPFYPIDNAALVNALAAWVPDETTRNRILVDNPARLFGF
jgi:predicted TIM-barrel fold metal-dependent hydrolase